MSNRSRNNAAPRPPSVKRAEGDRIRVFRVFRKQQLGRRIRSVDLSSSFREELLEQKNGSAEHSSCDEAEQPTLDLNAELKRLPT